ncbi:hypothetical protein DOY81_011295 [Sarcophaga bullata]|nr:hypothetical protein DOY81_011295 [Sarcophaga bullata]
MDIPPMPPLTKAPSHNNASSSLLTHNQTPPTLSPLPNLNSARHKRLRSEDNPPQTLPPIRSYGEARKYLKLLEDFALERENFRLIGLITRADEVLRELDRKENNEDEDVDID